MSVIFVPQEQRSKNISAALEYGTHFVSCLPQDYQVYASTADAVDKIRVALADYGPEDFLLLIGDPILIALTASDATANHDLLKVLKWDSQTRTYVPILLDLR
jgi:hypothetical protein